MSTRLAPGTLPSIGGDSSPLVSVIVIFLNAGAFLREAIESVRAQTYPHWELLLVDDGSTDESTATALEYSSRHGDRVRYLEHPGHENRGACAARNLGIANAGGELIALLDADDVWLPHKLERQVAILDANPEASIVCGRPMYWFSWSGSPEDRHADHAPIPGLPLNAVARPPEPLLSSYPLAVGSAPCPSDLLFRRSLAESVGGFEESFRGMYQLYEDQAFLAKVYTTAPIYVADECWLLYRQHPSSCLATVTRAGEYDTVRKRYLDWLETYLDERGLRDPRIHEALRRARHPYDHPMRQRLSGAFDRGKRMARKAISRYLPESLLALVPRSLHPGTNHPTPGRVRFGSLARPTPISSRWGWDRGLPVDRYYIDGFLARHAEHIRGHVLEVGDDRYCRRFAGDRVTRLDVLHVSEGNPQATLVADLCAADDIPPDSFDCIILTQTLQYIFDLDAAMSTLYRILRPGGHLLATVPGISRTEEEIDPPHLEQAERWKASRYWSLTRGSMDRLAGQFFPADHVDVVSFGNVRAAAAFLYGLAAEELGADALDHWDPAFPVIVALSARKPERLP